MQAPLYPRDEKLNENLSSLPEDVYTRVKDVLAKLLLERKFKGSYLFFIYSYVKIQFQILDPHYTQES